MFCRGMDADCIIPERVEWEINAITMDRKVRLGGILTDWHLQQILGKCFCSSATKLNIKMGEIRKLGVR